MEKQSMDSPHAHVVGLQGIRDAIKTWSDSRRSAPPHERREQGWPARDRTAVSSTRRLAQTRHRPCARLEKSYVNFAIGQRDRGQLSLGQESTPRQRRIATIVLGERGVGRTT